MESATSMNPSFYLCLENFLSIMCMTHKPPMQHTKRCIDDRKNGPHSLESQVQDFIAVAAPLLCNIRFYTHRTVNKKYFILLLQLGIVDQTVNYYDPEMLQLGRILSYIVPSFSFLFAPHHTCDSPASIAIHKA